MRRNVSKITLNIRPYSYQSTKTILGLRLVDGDLDLPMLGSLVTNLGTEETTLERGRNRVSDIGSCDPAF